MEIIFSTMLVFVRFMHFLTRPIYTLICKGKREVVPPVRDPLFKIHAVELARRIRSKEMSSEEICEAYIRRIKEVNPIINAVVEDRFEEAMKDAKAVDEYLKATSLSELEIEKIKPLLGVPMTIKESCSVEGMSISVGVVSRAGMKAEKDCDAVAILRSSGAILLLVSNTPEFCLSWETYNFITGCTKNPYDSTRTSGGSSGGEGALLGSGASLIGLGSDVAGSIRLPAMFNGVFGHKPTPQILSIKGHMPDCSDKRSSLYLVTGPIARYSCDLKFILKILVGNKMSSELKLDEPVNLRDLKVFYMVDFGSGLTQLPVESSIKNAINGAVKHLTTTCGATLDEYKFWHFKDSISVCFSTVSNMRDVPNSLKLAKANLAVEIMKSICGLSKFTINMMFFNCMRILYKYVVSDYVMENEMWRTAIAEKLDKNGVLILPSFVGPAQRHHQFYFKPALGYLIIANALGLPSTSIPCGLDHRDMPIGFQVMAAPGQDRLCLAVAEELERYFGGWVPPNELTIKVFGENKAERQAKYYAFLEEDTVPKVRCGLPLKECRQSASDAPIAKKNQIDGVLVKVPPLSDGDMEIIFNLLLAILRFLNALTAPIFNYRAKGKRQVLPPFKNELLRISATELAKKIRTKEISSREICKAYIRRIKEVNPILNAIVEERFVQALKDAKAVDESLKTTSLCATELEKIKPLLGVPITVKESCSVKGMSLCVGTISRIGFKAETDGEVVARLRSCGGIPLLVSNTSELCLGWESNNRVTGRTNNPYDSTCTTSGSSGGEGALLGAGASLVGIGSDLAGSIRIPAMFNGIFGHKPSPKIIPIKGHYPSSGDERVSDFLVIGPMTRYACDLKLLMTVMVGSKLSGELKLNEPVNLADLNVFHLEDFGFSLSLQSVTESIRHAIKMSVTHLEKVCGSKIQEFKFEVLRDALKVCTSVINSIEDVPNPMKWANTNLPKEACKVAFNQSKFSWTLINFFLLRALSRFLLGDYSVQKRTVQALITEKLGSNGVFLLPIFTEPAHKHNQFCFKQAFEYILPANVLGLPATVVPCGFDGNGMPIGIQVLAGPRQDRLCLAVAEELERCFGGWIPPPES
ncbi:uncharacterized protein LOC132702366 [Cylas formicarius]|uniref:uncharacterized protein LOC132702366 n=1 Tax=Cylas formicarius TaxID=197179 RepID=UPI002958376D|nr:uncharacterized protein LOC132702366 [Cylas formicarius]